MFLGGETHGFGWILVDLGFGILFLYWGGFERLGPLALLAGHKVIVFEEPLFKGAIGKPELALAMLHSKLPLAFVDSAINPVELPIAMALVVFVLATVHVSALPPELTLAMLHILEVVAGVLVARDLSFTLFPLTLPLFVTLEKLTCVDSP